MMPNAKRRLLLVDDEADIVKVISKYLESHGFEVSVAVNSQEALSKIAEARPDAIILDIMLPRISGFEICDRLKRDPRYGQIPIIIFTGKGHDEALCRKVGADAFVTKAGGGDALIREITRLLGNGPS